MNNANYWARRLKIMEDALKDQSYEYVKNLEQQFDAAIAQIDTQMRAWYQRFADNNGITFADAQKLLTTEELKEFKWTVQEYIEYGKEHAISGAWAKELENASARVHISRLDSLKLQLRQQAEALTDARIKATTNASEFAYTQSYYHTAFEVQRGLGVGWTMQALNTETVKKVLSRPWTVDNQTFTARCWTDKTKLVETVNQELTRMIATGEAPDKAIDAIAKRFNVSKQNAGRVVMTESAYFSSTAQKDCFNELGVEKYRVVGTLDNVTCGLCGDMDGKVFKMSEYQEGSTAPPFHPWCRCCTAPYFEDMEGIGERYSRDPITGKRKMLPKDTKYNDWAKQYITKETKLNKNKQNVLTPAQSGVIINTPTQTIGGLNCTVQNDPQYVFSDGSSNSARKPVPATIYTTTDGTRFVFPDKMDPKKQTMTPDQALSCWSKVPKQIREKAQSTIEFVDYYNPQDAHWKKVYKNFTQSYATGGDKITFYRYSIPHNDDYVVRTYCHEAGHHIDIISGGSQRYSSQQKWIDAMQADKAHSGKKSPTKYGENANTEDFAESIAEYSADKISFAQDFPNRSAIIKQLLGI